MQNITKAVNVARELGINGNLNLKQAKLVLDQANVKLHTITKAPWNSTIKAVLDELAKEEVVDVVCESGFVGDAETVPTYNPEQDIVEHITAKQMETHEAIEEVKANIDAAIKKFNPNIKEIVVNTETGPFMDPFYTVEVQGVVGWNVVDLNSFTNMDYTVVDEIEDHYLLAMDKANEERAEEIRMAQLVEKTRRELKAKEERENKAAENHELKLIKGSLGVAVDIEAARLASELKAKGHPVNMDLLRNVANGRVKKIRSQYKRVTKQVQTSQKVSSFNTIKGL